MKVCDAINQSCFPFFPNDLDNQLPRPHADDGSMGLFQEKLFRDLEMWKQNHMSQPWTFAWILQMKLSSVVETTD